MATKQSYSAQNITLDSILSLLPLSCISAMHFSNHNSEGTMSQCLMACTDETKDKVLSFQRVLEEWGIEDTGLWKEHSPQKEQHDIRQGSGFRDA